LSDRTPGVSFSSCGWGNESSSTRVLVALPLPRVAFHHCSLVGCLFNAQAVRLSWSAFESRPSRSSPLADSLCPFMPSCCIRVNSNQHSFPPKQSLRLQPPTFSFFRKKRHAAHQTMLFRHQSRSAFHKNNNNLFLQPVRQISPVFFFLRSIFYYLLCVSHLISPHLPNLRLSPSVFFFHQCQHLQTTVLHKNKLRLSTNSFQNLNLQLFRYNLIHTKDIYSLIFHVILPITSLHRLSFPHHYLLPPQHCTHHHIFNITILFPLTIHCILNTPPSHHLHLHLFSVPIKSIIQLSILQNAYLFHHHLFPPLLSQLSRVK
jgi:hypothetical protein